MKQTTIDDLLDQREHLRRVRSRIGRSVLAFVRGVGVDGEFRAVDLRAHVERECETAPASADRILRDLRGSGHIDYEIVNRRQSLYRVLAVREL
jgi:hypothetical protein